MNKHSISFKKQVRTSISQYTYHEEEKIAYYLNLELPTKINNYKLSALIPNKELNFLRETKYLIICFLIQCCYFIEFY